MDTDLSSRVKRSEYDYSLDYDEEQLDANEEAIDIDELLRVESQDEPDQTRKEIMLEPGDIEGFDVIEAVDDKGPPLQKLENEPDGTFNFVGSKESAIPQGDCICGDLPNGTNAGEAMARPWMVQFLFKPDTGSEYECSGVLINKRWKISAAHCFCRARSVRIGTS